MTLFLFLLYLSQHPTTKIWAAGDCTAYLAPANQVVFTVCAAGKLPGAFESFDPHTLEYPANGAIFSHGDVAVIWQKNSPTDLLHYQVAQGGAVILDCLPQVCGDGACVLRPDACGTAIPW